MQLSSTTPMSREDHISAQSSFSVPPSTLSDQSSSREADKFVAKAERALHDASEATNRLNLSTVPLVGRDKELERLRSVVDQLTTRQEDNKEKVRLPRVFSVSGPAGTGKSFLVEKLRPWVLEKGGFFIRGKFDQHSRGEAYTGLATAMDELVQQIIARDFDMGIRRRVQEAVGPEDATVLIELFPSLATILPAQAQSQSPDSQWEQRATRRRFLFQQFIRAILSSKTYEDEDIDSEEEETPALDQEEVLSIVLALDDLQWIDRPSLDLVSSLVRAGDSGPFLLVATNRPLDGSASHVYLEEIERWKNQTIEIQSLPLENLGVSDVSMIVASVLDSADEISLPLATIVHKKTLGNPFFAMEFLKALVEQRLLTYSYGDLKWRWDEDSVQSLAITDNAGGLLSAKLKRLPNERQAVLFITACLGLTFEKKLLQKVIDVLKDEDGVAYLLGAFNSIDVVMTSFVEFGFLGFIGGRYFFVHDLIKQAVVNLIPTSTSALLRLRVGQCILKETGQQRNVASRSLLILGADLCNGSLSLLGRDELVDLARYNLLAGEKTMRESAFALALRYMKAGLSCLEEQAPSMQQQQDQVYLKLLAGAAEASYCAGDYESMDTFSDRLLSMQCSADLEMSMLFYKIQAATAQDRHKEALEIGRAALKSLGMGVLPRKPGMARVVQEIIKTRKALRKHSKESLEALPILSDKKRIAAMDIITVLKVSSYLINRKFFIVSFLKLVRWSLKYGISRYSPGGFVVYGLILSSTFGDVQAGTMFGEVALTLCDRLDVKQTSANVSMSVFAYIHHWTNDMRSCYQPIEYSSKLAMECGDTESALFARIYMIHLSWCTSSSDLRTLGRDLERLCYFIRDHKHWAMLEAVTFLARSFQKLCSGDDGCYCWLDYFSTTGRLRRSESGDQAVDAFYDSVSLSEQYLLGNDDEALRLARATAEVGIKVCQGQFYVTRTQFYCGLSFIGAASNGQNTKRYTRQGRHCLKLLKNWSDCGSVSCLHMVYLLEAELYKTKKQYEKAAEFYANAIKAANLSGHIHDLGICYEKTADFQILRSDAARAAQTITQAVNCFNEWGAVAKVGLLRGKYAGVLPAYAACGF